MNGHCSSTSQQIKEVMRQGRLTQDITIKFQHYYRFAVMNNIGDSEAMRNAI